MCESDCFSSPRMDGIRCGLPDNARRLLLLVEQYIVKRLTIFFPTFWNLQLVTGAYLYHSMTPFDSMHTYTSISYLVSSTAVLLSLPNCIKESSTC